MYIKNYWRRPDDSRKTGGKEDQGRKVDARYVTAHAPTQGADAGMYDAFSEIHKFSTIFFLLVNFDIQRSCSIKKIAISYS